jgi:hypothetical protein
VIGALEGCPGRLILAGVPWVTSRFPSIILGYNMESLSELDYLVLYTKLSSCLWAHKSGRAGSTDRSEGLLVGQALLSGTAETLVGGDPCLIGRCPLLITHIRNGHKTTTVTTASHRSREMVVSLAPQRTLVTSTKTKPVTETQHQQRVL